MKIELDKTNERIFRKMYQFLISIDNKIIYKVSFEKFINNWIKNKLAKQK